MNNINSIINSNNYKSYLINKDGKFVINKEIEELSNIIKTNNNNFTNNNLNKNFNLDFIITENILNHILHINKFVNKKLLNYLINQENINKHFL